MSEDLTSWWETDTGRAAIERERQVSAAMSTLFRRQDEERARLELPRSDTIQGFVTSGQPDQMAELAELARIVSERPATPSPAD